jgi:SAM-dependent methyltransferase
MRYSMNELPYWRAAERDYDWFEHVYKDATSIEDVPWARSEPNRMLDDWLSLYSQEILQRSALVVGCGLGDDAELLSKTGFSVSAFDISANAIQWCKERFPKTKVNYFQADLFTLRFEEDSKFDLAVEISTLQALPRHLLQPAAFAISESLKVNGELVVIAKGRELGIELPPEPPWPLTLDELMIFEKFNCNCVDIKTEIVSSGKRPGPRYRLVFKKL